MSNFAVFFRSENWQGMKTLNINYVSLIQNYWDIEKTNSIYIRRGFSWVSELIKYNWTTCESEVIGLLHVYSTMLKRQCFQDLLFSLYANCERNYLLFQKKFFLSLVVWKARICSFPVFRRVYVYSFLLPGFKSFYKNMSTLAESKSRITRFFKQIWDAHNFRKEKCTVSTELEPQERRIDFNVLIVMYCLNQTCMCHPVCLCYRSQYALINGVNTAGVGTSGKRCNACSNLKLHLFCHRLFQRMPLTLTKRNINQFLDAETLLYRDTRSSKTCFLGRHHKKGKLRPWLMIHSNWVFAKTWRVRLIRREEQHLEVFT